MLVSLNIIEHRERMFRCDQEWIICFLFKIGSYDHQHWSSWWFLSLQEQQGTYVKSGGWQDKSLWLVSGHHRYLVCSFSSTRNSVAVESWCYKSWPYKYFSLPPCSPALISTSPGSSWQAQMASPFVCKPQIELWLSWWLPLSYSNAPSLTMRKGR